VPPAAIARHAPLIGRGGGIAARTEPARPHSDKTGA
jgi:hypothetical protein